MMQQMTKWKVTVTMVDSSHNLTFWIYDNHVSNVLRQVAAMQFSENGLETPIEITISQ